jgi:hypothetical protein
MICSESNSILLQINRKKQLKNSYKNIKDKLNNNYEYNYLIKIIV